VASDKHEGGKIIIKPTSIVDLTTNGIPFFTCFFVAGHVPPTSVFCHVVVAMFGLHLAKLNPQAILVMAVFKHLCEGFVGVMPSVVLFWHFYTPRTKTTKVLAGGVTWRFYNNLADKSKWDEWHSCWCYVRVGEIFKCFEDPATHAVHHKDRGSLGAWDKDFSDALVRIKML
jgi:hypothetical protein